MRTRVVVGGHLVASSASLRRLVASPPRRTPCGWLRVVFDTTLGLGGEEIRTPTPPTLPLGHCTDNSNRPDNVSRFGNGTDHG